MSIEEYSINFVLENTWDMYRIPAHTKYSHGGIHHTIDFKAGLSGYKCCIIEEFLKDINKEKRQFLLGMKGYSREINRLCRTL